MDGEILNHKQPGRKNLSTTEPGKKQSPNQIPGSSAPTVRTIKVFTERTQTRKGVMPVAHHQERKL